MAEYTVCGRRWFCGGMRDGEWSVTADGGTVSVRDPDGKTVPVPPDGVACAVKYRWEEIGERDLPFRLTVNGTVREAYPTTVGDRVTQVTVEAGCAEFSPEKIPLSCAHPLMGDPVPAGGKTVRVCALRFGSTYAAVFPETAGDLVLPAREKFLRGILPPGTEIFFAFAPDDRTLCLRRAYDTDAVTAEGLGAGLVSAVRCGRCLPDTAVRLPFDGGEARGICRRNGDVILTLPVKDA